MALKLMSTAFDDGAPIPKRYTGEGSDVCPPLQWTQAPAGARALALICEDPDAPRGTFTHWVLFNVPAETRELPEGVPPEGTLPNGATQGTNDFGKLGYKGPMPPPRQAPPLLLQALRPRPGGRPPTRSEQGRVAGGDEGTYFGGGRASGDVCAVKN